MPVRALTPSAGQHATSRTIHVRGRNGARWSTRRRRSLSSQAMSDATTHRSRTPVCRRRRNDWRDNDMILAYPWKKTAANLVCVAATDNTDALAGVSELRRDVVDLAAPGVDITRLDRDDSPDAFSDDFETGLGKWTAQSGPWGTATALNTRRRSTRPGATTPTTPTWAIRTASPVDVGIAPTARWFTDGTFLEPAGLVWCSPRPTAPPGRTWRGSARPRAWSGPPFSSGVGQSLLPPSSTLDGSVIRTASTSTTCASRARRQPRKR